MKRSITVKQHMRNGKVVKAFKRDIDSVINIAHNVVRKLKHNAEDFIEKGNQYQDALDRLDKLKEFRAKQAALAKPPITKDDVVAKYKEKRNLLDKLSGYHRPTPPVPVNPDAGAEKYFGKNYKRKGTAAKKLVALRDVENKRFWANYDKEQARYKALRAKTAASEKPQIDYRKK